MLRKFEKVNGRMGVYRYFKSKYVESYGAFEFTNISSTGDADVSDAGNR